MMPFTPAIAATALALSAGLVSPSLMAATEKPNVILIYGDDVGYGDVGVYGSKKIPTPNLDRIAGEGLRFTDGHCSSATCTPSRYSLLTGELPFRKANTGIAAGDATMIISPDQFTLADVFKNAGYTTAVVGKWHLGLDDERIDWNQTISPGPEALGFDHHFIIAATADRVPIAYVENGKIVNLDPADPITISYKGPIPDSVPGTAYPDAQTHPEAATVYKGDRQHSDSVINGISRIGYMKGGKSALFKDEDLADDLVREAEEFIRANREKPFFLYLSTSDIHAPRWPHSRFRGMSQNGLRGDSMVSFDWCVGAIDTLLKELGLADNTMVIISSDNGPVYNDGYEDGCVTKKSTGPSDRGHFAAGPYRGGKYQVYEGGTRVPFIVRWPAAVKPGVSDALMTQTDLLASFAAHFGQTIPTSQARDSRNHFDALIGKDPKGAEFIVECAQGNDALRQGQWKYIPKNDELYDLATDPGETKNLAEAQPAKAKELSERMIEIRKNALRD